jgi:hypothetical protein
VWIREKLLWKEKF